MPTPRAVFRIAEYFAVDEAGPREQIFEEPAGDASPDQCGQLASAPQLARMHQSIDVIRQEIVALQARFGKQGQGRLGREINAVIDTTRQATQDILLSAEIIEDLARSLTASLRLPQERDMVRDILDHVTRIFETCNFQDVTGQHLTQAIATFQFVEDRVARMSEIWDGGESGAAMPQASLAPDAANDLLNGPKLHGESGHISQSEIDQLFSGTTG